MFHDLAYCAVLQTVNAVFTRTTVQFLLPVPEIFSSPDIANTNFSVLSLPFRITTSCYFGNIQTHKDYAFVGIRCVWHITAPVMGYLESSLKKYAPSEEVADVDSLDLSIICLLTMHFVYKSTEIFITSQSTSSVDEYLISLW